MIPLPAFYAFIFLRKFLFQNVAVKEEKQGRLTPCFSFYDTVSERYYFRENCR